MRAVFRLALRQSEELIASIMRMLAIDLPIPDHTTLSRRGCGLPAFAQEARAGVGRIILLVLDNAGWHTEPGLVVPDGIRLVHLPPCTPELQPAECLRELVDEPIVNRHFDTLDELQSVVETRCIGLAQNLQATKAVTGFHWWPKIAEPI